MEICEKRSNGTGNAVMLVMATLSICVLSLALPLLTLQIYDRILPHPDSGTFPVLVAGLCMAVVFEVILRLARSRIIAWNGACQEHNIACQAVDRMLGADLNAFNTQGVGASLNGFSAIGRIKEFYSGQSLVGIVEAVLLPVYFILIAYIAGWLVLVPLAVVAVFTTMAVFMGVRLRTSLVRRDAADDRRYDFLVESLEGVHTLKSFALEERFIRRYEALERDSTMRTYDVTDDSARIFNISTVFGHVMLVSVVAAGASMVLDGMMTSGALIATILLSGRIMQPVQRIVGLWVRYQDYQVAQKKVGAILSLPQQYRAQTFTAPDRAGELEIKDAGLRIGEKWLFRHVNLSVRCGEAVRLTGMHGAGKSALLQMIAGLYSPSEGTVSVDGISPLDYPPSARLQHVALLRTTGIVFQGSIRDNITRFGAVSEEQAREVTALLGIDRDVAALARGFDTMLQGTESDVIPPGLRQRIAIARALAERPRVILFDNADRNLDRDGYAQVYNLLGRLRERIALVLVSDDQNIIRMADRHISLEEDGLRPIDSGHSGLMYGSKHI